MDTTNRGPLTTGRGLSILALVVVALCIALVGAGSASAANKKKDPPPCTLSSGTGDLVATDGGFAANTTYQYEVYASPTANVGGGNLTTDASGNFNDDLGPASFYMSVYPNETTLTFNVYPIIGNKADLNVVLASCST